MMIIQRGNKVCERKRGRAKGWVESGLQAPRAAAVLGISAEITGAKNSQTIQQCDVGKDYFGLFPFPLIFGLYRGAPGRDRSMHQGGNVAIAAPHTTCTVRSSFTTAYS